MEDKAMHRKPFSTAWLGDAEAYASGFAVKSLKG